MVKIKNVKLIDVSDWNKLVSETYGKVYDFQQQEGCQDRGQFKLIIPSGYEDDEEEMNYEIPEIVNNDTMGVKFEKWLERDPKQVVHDESVGIRNEQWAIDMWWQRNFYPSIFTVANDLYKRGLIDAGEYFIDINW